MAIEGLTQQQSDFVERFLKVPKVFNRKAAKERRRAAAQQFRLFNAEYELLRAELDAIDDVELRSVMRAQLHAAETIIESDPKNLNFEGGHQQLDDVRHALLLHIRKADALRAFGQLQTAMDRLDTQNPIAANALQADAQSDIALTWTFVQEKLAHGADTNNLSDLDAALRAMGRLQDMMRRAEEVGQNPFEARLAEVGSAADAARAQLKPEVRAARQQLSDTFNQLDALRDKLATQFGAEGVPLALRMGCTSTQRKLDEAMEAPADALVDLADDAADAFAAVNKDALKVIDAALQWERDHAAFRIRYEVMLTHPVRANPQAKPEFDKITAAYTAATEIAKDHKYLQASQDIALVRNDLKDTLDFADAYARYLTVLADRKKLLGTLPDPATYAVASLRQDHADALALLPKAHAARLAKQMSAALGHLNAIPKAVEDILEINRFAKNFGVELRIYAHYVTKIAAKSSPEIAPFIADDLAYGETTKTAAQKDFDEGIYRSASGRMLALRGHMAETLSKTRLIADYLLEKAAFTERRRETRRRRGPEGRIAIEDYYQSLLGDEAKRKTAEASGDFRLARAMCQRLKTVHDDKMRLADDAKRYLEKKAAFDAELAKLSGETSHDAMDARTTAQAMHDNAVAATARGNWFGAAALLDSAQLEIQRAVSDAQTAALIDGQQGKVALSEDTAFETAYQVFATVLKHVSDLDTKARFSEGLAAAEAQAQSAQAQMADDLAGAEQTLKDALEACRVIAAKVTAAASYDAQSVTTDALINTAETAGADGVIDAELAAAKEARKAAVAAVKPPATDFAAAIDLLAKAQSQARQGQDAMALYAATIKDARTTMQDATSAYSHADVVAYLQPEADRVQAVLDAMNTDFDSRNLSEAQRHAEKGTTLAATHLSLCDACKKAAELIHDELVGHGGIELTHPVTTQEAAELATLTAAALDALAKRSFTHALHVGEQAYNMMWDAREKAERFDLYLPVKIACENQLDPLEIRTAPEAGPGHEAVVALRTAFDAACAQEALENYAGAAKRLAGFAAKCDAAKALLDTYDRYALQKTRAQSALEQLKQRNSPAIETLLVRLESKDRNADRKGQGFDFAAATALYQELETECQIAGQTAETAEEFATATSLLKVVAPGDQDDLLAAIAKARSTVEGLQGKASSMYVFADILECRATLDQAAKGAEEDFESARSEVEQVLDRCLEVTLLMGQYEQLESSATIARALGDAMLKRGAEADFARQEITNRMAAIDLAMNAARQSRANRALTQTDVEAAIAAFRDLSGVIDAQQAYLAKRTPIDARLAQLEKSGRRHLFSDDLIAARRTLETAATRAADRNHASADQELDAAALRLDAAELRGQLARNRVPTAEALEKLLDAPGGTDILDDIVDALEANVQRRVMAVVFEARFGCRLEMQKQTDAVPAQDAHGNDLQLPTDANGNVPPGPDVAEDGMRLPAPNLRRFYKEMRKLPPSNTLDNDSMVGFLHLSGEQRGSAFDPTHKKVLMREGDEASSRIYSIAVAHEIGELDPRAVPKPGQERTAFSWNTLHEVGHAVDDKLGYMKKHGARLAGWKVYGANVAEPARIIAQEFDFDADYVAEYMVSTAGRQLPIPDPKGCAADEWHRRMAECRNFVDRARSENDPWDSASISAACAIGDHTYVESYPGDWARYRTVERKLAVSGYQFRAPGEWFSELYAALCTDRLNAAHPHRDEMAKLCLAGDI